MTIGILLAGGASSRFIHGDKALYQDFPERTFQTLSDLVNPVFVSAKPENIADLQTRLPKAKFVLDEVPYQNEGPLSGLYAVAKKSQDNDFLILAVDYPEVSHLSLKKLLEQKNAYAADNYTVAHLHFELAQIESFLANGKRRVREFLREIKATEIKLPENELVNHNKE